MYRVTGERKRDPVLRWGMPDRVFFACGACHILAYAFMERYGPAKLKAAWLKPDPGFTGNHVFITADGWVFDYHGYSRLEGFLEHTRRKASCWWPGWNATSIELQQTVLVSEARSRTYDGLWLREPRQFLHDAMPRALAFLDRFPPPPIALTAESSGCDGTPGFGALDYGHEPDPAAPDDRRRVPDLGHAPAGLPP